MVKIIFVLVAFNSLLMASMDAGGPSFESSTTIMEPNYSLPCYSNSAVVEVWESYANKLNRIQKIALEDLRQYGRTHDRGDTETFDTDVMKAAHKYQLLMEHEYQNVKLPPFRPIDDKRCPELLDNEFYKTYTIYFGLIEFYANELIQT